MDGEIKAMKQMSPKDSVSSKMWLRVARSVDKVDGMMERGVQLLNYSDESNGRFTNISKEIVHWRAFLRHSQYLSQKIW